MADKSSIEWTDATWNPTTGCHRISPGCANCYAKTIHDRRHKAFLDGWATAPAQYHQPFEVVQTRDDRLTLPLKWQKPRRIFVDSMSDLFHESVSDEFIDKVFAVMALAPRHTFQILTKRAERMRAYLAPGQFRDVKVADAAKALHTTVQPFALPAEAIFNARRVAHGQSWAINAWPLPNVWLGVSVENQHFADERIPKLLQTLAAVRFISAEPLLSAIEISKFLTTGDSDNPNNGALNTHGQTESKANSADTLGPASRNAVAKNVGAIRQIADRPVVRKIDLVIVGGESDTAARDFDLMWGRSLVEQCHGAGVAAFVKQVGAKAWDSSLGRATADHRTHVIREHGRAYLRLKHPKGGDMAEWPEDLRVREFPTEAIR